MGSDRNGQHATIRQMGNTNCLRALYNKNYTLVEALHLIDGKGSFIREAMTRGLTDQMAEKDWVFANELWL